ncbi:MAG: type II secretion pathway protein GspD, partial [Nitrosomonas sp.]
HFGTASEAGKLPVKIDKTKAQSLAITPGGVGQASARGGANPFAAQVDEDAPNPFARAAAASASSTPSLTLQAPTNVGLDKEFSVNVRLVGTKATTNTELQFSYDSGSFELLDGGPKSGSRSIRLGKDQIAGLATQLRFKVIATAAGTGEVSIQSANGEDIEHGDAVDVTLPPPATINFK